MSELFSSTPLSSVILLELSFTSALVGLIWLIQLVHYPLFASVGAPSFANYEREHCRRMSFVVIPLMCGELIFCLLHLFYSECSSDSVIGAILLAVVWASTFFIQVPLHQRLNDRFCAAAHRALVRSNWIRTLSWTARTVLLLWSLLPRLNFMAQ